MAEDFGFRIELCVTENEEFIAAFGQVLGLAVKRELPIGVLHVLHEVLSRLEESLAKQEESLASPEDGELLTDILLDIISRIKTDEEVDAILRPVLQAMLPKAFATVREAARRTLGMRHFDVQLIGGVVLHEGKIAEMRTGEGKTLVATLAAYLNSLTRRGVHVVTVNDYLAKRDASWMGAVYHALDVSVGCLQNQSALVFDPGAAEKQSKADENADSGSTSFAAVAGESMRKASRKEAYEADITYGTNNEFGFDYLRDNMVEELPRMVQQEKRAYAIVDEVDNILIDEARTPLIISGPAQESGQEYKKYKLFARIALKFKRGEHYEVDEKRKSILLTDEGSKIIEKELNVKNLQSESDYKFAFGVENALRANALYLKDREYVVRDNEVLLVDEFTGRLMEGRRFSDGLHQAIEAKEDVQIRRVSATYATITLQNYFRLYDKLAGMTGTAVTEAEEFFKIYKLEVVEIPTNQPMVRDDMPDLIYMTEDAKWNAVASKIEELHRGKRPVLVGTTSIEKSEHLAGLLRRRKVPHQVLNAKQHEKEATIVAQAGRPGAVTVATNMAGRGTDIILGGNPDTIDVPLEEWQGDQDLVLENGGLFVLGTERHEARRIDNQLRGRSGRQGDPGATQFMVSTEDDLIRRFGGDRMRGAMNMFGWEEDLPLENKMITRTVEGAQNKVEGHHFEIRKHLVDYDDVINTHRDVIYNLRHRVLKGEGLRPTILEYVDKELLAIATAHLEGDVSNWDIEGFQLAIRTVMPIPERLEDPDGIAELEISEIESLLHTEAESLYDVRTLELGEEAMRWIERTIMLRAIDRQWVNHLTEMDNMRQGIGLRAAGQRDPLIEYKKQSYDMFKDLLTQIETQIARDMFRETLALRAALVSGRTAGRPTGSPSRGNGRAPQSRNGRSTGQKSIMSNVNQGHGAATGTGNKKIGRNQRCPCGSGKKYKRCCGRA